MVNKNRIEISEFLGKIDLFICSSGFEERSVLLGTSLTSSNIEDSIVFQMDDTYKASHDNLDRIKANLKNLKEAIYPKNDSINTFDIIFTTLASQIDPRSRKNVVIDITTFTREVMLILIKILSLDEFRKAFSVKLVYTPAESYPNEWLTKGIRQIRSVFGYSGMTSPSKKLLLVILNGFETERTEEIIDAFESDMIILGKPSVSESINKELGSIASNKFDYIQNKYESITLDNFEFSCKDVHKTKEVLNGLVDKYQDDYNIVISPLNNKISTLGAALVSLDNEVVKICYASANQYNINNYSKGSDYFMIYDLEKLLTH